MDMHTEVKPQRTPTDDERAGMEWWNGLSHDARTHWLNRRGCWNVAEAWRQHKADVLREQSTAEQRVISEHRAANNVAVTVCAGAEIRMLCTIANDMEANGDTPDIHFFRDDAGVRGLVLTGRLSRETVSRAPEIKIEEVPR